MARVKNIGLALVAADPAVESVWSEGDDGYWASLKPGYKTNSDTTALHEYTVGDLVTALETIEEGYPSDWPPEWCE